MYHLPKVTGILPALSGTFLWVRLVVVVVVVVVVAVVVVIYTNHLKVRVSAFFFFLVQRTYNSLNSTFPFRTTRTFHQLAQSTWVVSFLRHTTPTTFIPLPLPFHISPSALKLPSKITDIGRSRITIALRRHVGPRNKHSLLFVYSAATK